MIQTVAIMLCKSEGMEEREEGRNTTQVRAGAIWDNQKEGCSRKTPVLATRETPHRCEQTKIALQMHGRITSWKLILHHIALPGYRYSSRESATCRPIQRRAKNRESWLCTLRLYPIQGCLSLRAPCDRHGRGSQLVEWVFFAHPEMSR